MASGINDCVFEDCLVEEGNEEETQGSFLILEQSPYFRLCTIMSLKEGTKPPFILWMATQNMSFAEIVNW